MITFKRESVSSSSVYARTGRETKNKLASRNIDQRQTFVFNVDLALVRRCLTNIYAISGERLLDLLSRSSLYSQ